MTQEDIKILIRISKENIDPELKGNLLEIISKVHDEYHHRIKVDSGYIDICAKVRCICQKLPQKTIISQRKIFNKSFEFILNDEKRKKSFLAIIKSSYLKSKGHEYYLFENEEDVDLSKVTIDMLESRHFKSQHKQELGFMSMDSIKQLFKKSKCKKLSEEQIDKKYKSYAGFLTNMCQGLKIDIQFLFYTKNEKLFESDEEYLQYIDKFFTQPEIKNDSSQMLRTGQNNMDNMHYIYDKDIKNELNISNEDLVKYINNFMYSDGGMYDVNIQNTKLILDVLKKAFMRGLDDQLLLDFISKLELCEEYDRFINNEDIILQHKSKIYSNLSNDNKAIEILKYLLSIQESNPNKFTINSYSETLNLLAASLKRYSFEIVTNLNEDDGRKELLIKNLSEAKKIYEKALIHSFDDKYYSAINISYIVLILGNLNENDIDKTFDTLDSIWENIEINVTNYWSWITDIEKNIIFKNYERAKDKIKKPVGFIDLKYMQKFHVMATIRQLKLYRNFSDEEDKNKIDEICTLLDNRVLK
ncbi:MAG: hypothetical protein GQ531_10380 [Sulfurovum sp.]|nr:hypothetical protein [Sulfurovum sp.]